ncbi:hypothetical protein Pla108_13880 [Botrimarina colliarenosi]|uniref:Uncharacterized protein n=1 Tax=Botrimarina colliarenosi TaxID=2528001 RepID=A0A5C6ALU3_9BACT|nr:hypothetical protein [Botrimarina colliarenosi]TWU00437.1 hypothetical protein Pla108_13880 [Botrimarina colliarenosi]
MRKLYAGRLGFAWLELLLALAIVSLLLQLFNVSATRLYTAMDMRTWSGGVWFLAFALVFVVLCGVRFGPEVAKGFVAQDRKFKLTVSEEKMRKRKEYEKERALYERMNEARKRQS